MTLVSTLITRGYREANIIDVRATPTDDENTEALALLENILRSTLGGEVGYYFDDWTVASADVITPPSGQVLSATEAAAWYVEPNARLQCSLTVATAIDLDPFPMDGQRFAVMDVAGNFATFNLTLNGNGRKINSTTSLVLSADDTNREFMYRGDIGEWTEIATLTTGATFPFPVDFDDYFTTALAIRLNPRHMRELPEETKAVFTRQQQQIASRYRQSRLNDLPLDKPE